MIISPQDCDCDCIYKKESQLQITILIYCFNKINCMHTFLVCDQYNDQIKKKFDCIK